MPAWMCCQEHRNHIAFLAPVPVQRTFRKSADSSSSSRTHRHVNTPGLFPGIHRRADSLLPSQACNRISPSAEASVTQATSSKVPVILLVDHGSRRATANDMLSDIAAMLREKTDLLVHTAHMEIASPTIADGIDKCVREGATHVIVVPFFLSPGRHATTDIPQLTAEAVANHPGVTYDVRPPIGTHPGIIDVILDRAGLPGSAQK